MADIMSLAEAVICPFTGEQLTAVPALNPDVTIIHGQRADRRGNVQLWGLLGVQNEAVLAAKRCVVTPPSAVELAALRTLQDRS